VHLLKRLMYQEQLIGAAYLLGDIYVIAKECLCVLVYTGHSPYCLQNTIYLGVMKAVDIVTSYIDICVYVLDDGNGKVWRIGQNHAVSTTVDGLERRSLLSMSVNENGQLIIVRKNSEILTYGRDGNFISALPSPLQQTGHAIESVANIIVCNDFVTAMVTSETQILHAQPEVGGHYISMDRNANAIVCDPCRHQIVELDSKSLQVTATLLTLDRDGIEKPTHVQYVLENGMLLVTWMNCLDVYSFREKATKGYLTSSESDFRQQQTREAEMLERRIAHTNHSFRSLVDLYRRSGMDCIFRNMPPYPRESELFSASFRSLFQRSGMDCFFREWPPYPRESELFSASSAREYALFGKHEVLIKAQDK